MKILFTNGTKTWGGVKTWTIRLIREYEVSTEGETNTPSANRLSRFISKCQGVSVSNTYLKKWAEQFNSNITIIPTCVEISSIYCISYEDLPVQVVGWIGAPENQRPLLNIFPELRAVLNETPDRVLHVVTQGHWNFDSERVHYINWDIDTYREKIQRFTIGLAPLEDSEWTRGKMQFKAIQYAAQGVPVVASPVGLNKAHWRDGENIFFAENGREFEKKIRNLLESRDLRKKMGLAALQTIQESYTAEANVEVLVRHLT